MRSLRPSLAVGCLLALATACTDAPTAPQKGAAISARSDIVVATVAPIAPSNLVGSIIGYRSKTGEAFVTLTWTDNSTDESGFRVDGVGSRGANYGGDWPADNTIQTVAWPGDTWTIVVRSYITTSDGTRVYSDPSNSIVLKTCSKANDPKCR